jgi:hypothetical protein
MSDGENSVKGCGLLSTLNPDDRSQTQASKRAELFGGQAARFAVLLDNEPKLARQSRRSRFSRPTALACLFHSVILSNARERGRPPADTTFLGYVIVRKGRDTYRYGLPP